MQQMTQTVQFLIIGQTNSGKRFEERLNFKFLPTATPSDIAQKRAALKRLYEARGSQSVSVYTVSPHLQKHIES